MRRRYYSDDYHEGFRDGYSAGYLDAHEAGRAGRSIVEARNPVPPKKERKVSAWNKFVKANSKKKEFRYASGKVNLKKLGVAYRKKQRGKR
jgi:hypothetical protein